MGMVTVVQVEQPDSCHTPRQLRCPIFACPPLNRVIPHPLPSPKPTGLSMKDPDLDFPGTISLVSPTPLHLSPALVTLSSPALTPQGCRLLPQLPLLHRDDSTSRTQGPQPELRCHKEMTLSLLSALRCPSCPCPSLPQTFSQLTGVGRRTKLTGVAPCTTQRAAA